MENTTRFRYDGRWAAEHESDKFLFLDIGEELQSLLHSFLNSGFKCGIYTANVKIPLVKIDETWAKIPYEDLISGAIKLKCTQEVKSLREIPHCDFKICEFDSEDCFINGCKIERI